MDSPEKVHTYNFWKFIQLKRKQNSCIGEEMQTWLLYESVSIQKCYSLPGLSVSSTCVVSISTEVLSITQLFDGIPEEKKLFAIFLLKSSKQRSVHCETVILKIHKNWSKEKNMCYVWGSQSECLPHNKIA